ncbi:MAG: PTS system mannose/fructose/sorbose family transporter subunit IID [Erysipelotrichaceae bacterium]|uniref:PTS system mannose/fructose/sorbose family transporter subunit IID n=1 Tax=Anaerorhabdus sp. TaxID=1872524 RepID=UPI002FC9DD62
MTMSSNITKKDLNRMAINQGSMGMEFSWNYERQMHIAFAMMMNPVLKKIYKDNKEGYDEALVRHLEFFNITPQFAPFVGGVVTSMEEMHANGEIDASAIAAIKTALMGPLSGIGDSIFIGCIRIIALGVGLSLCKSGNPLGPIAYFLIYNIPAFATRFLGVQLGYNLGFSYLTKMREDGMMDKLLMAAGILGIMVIGAMSKEMVYTGISLTIGSGKTATPLQGILDGIMPGMVGLGVTWLYYYLLKKKVNVLVLIMGTLIVGVLGVACGVFG